MKFKTVFLIPSLVYIAFAGVSTASAVILTFDNLGVTEGPVPNGYGLLQWQNFFYMSVTHDGTGYANSLVSPYNVAYDGFGTNATISGGMFSLNSAYLTAAWVNGLQVEVKGFSGSALTYDNTYTVNTTGPTLINFNYQGVTEVEFIPSGGTPAFSGGYNGTHFAMDNLDVTFGVPEPSTFALAGLSVVVLIRSNPHFKTGRRRSTRSTNS
jgi:hypothetical protein